MVVQWNLSNSRNRNNIHHFIYGDKDASFAVELDDGHEDMHESAMTAALETGLDYMQSEEVELTFMEALDFVIAEQANL